MGLASPALLILALTFGWTGCGSSDDTVAPPDATPTQLTCEGDGSGQGEPFGLRLGLAAEDNGFVELADGDDCPLVTGAQGLLMLITEMRSDLAIDAEGICMYCDLEMGPAGDFQGASLAGSAIFRDVGGGDLSAQSIFILGAAGQLTPVLDGADVELTLACDGHGYAAAIDRSLHLMVPQ